MALTIQTNSASITALKHLNANTANLNKSLERLSSGYRINSAADDAAGYAISSKLDAQAGRLKAASQNVSQAIAMVRMADAGIQEIQNMISRIQTLATQAASSNNAGELAKLDAERIKLESQIDKIANSTNYNGVNLLNGLDASTPIQTGAGTYTAGTNTGITGVTLVSNSKGVNDSYTIDVATDGLTVTIKDKAGVVQATSTLTAGATTNVTLNNGTVLGITVGTKDTVNVGAGAGGTFAVSGAGHSAYTGPLAFQVGADNNRQNQVLINLGNSYTTSSLGLGTGDLTTQANAQAYIDTAKAALDTLITQRADLGATQNQLQFVQANLATSVEQAVSSVSTIRDADMATEMAQFTKNQILVQAGTAMLAQANQVAQNVLSLFR